MVKNSTLSIVEVIQSAFDTLGKLYLRREKLKDKLRTTTSDNSIRDLVKKFKDKSVHKEEKVIRMITKHISDVLIRDKIIKQIKKGLQKLAAPRPDQTINNFLNEMTDFNAFYKTNKFEKLIKKAMMIEKSSSTPSPPMSFPPRQIIYSLPSSIRTPLPTEVNVFEGWPLKIQINSILSTFRPEFLQNLTATERKRLKLITVSGCVSFLSSGANYESCINSDFNMKVAVKQNNFRLDVLKYLGCRVYFDPDYMLAVKNLFLLYGLRVFFNHKEFPLRINFLKPTNMEIIENNVVLELMDCGMTVSFGPEKRSIYVTGSAESEQQAKKLGEFD
jgi:hypothetical protein